VEGFVTIEGIARSAEFLRRSRLDSMYFKVTARTLLHLGAELISSDAVAFYELIKNGFDAGSPRVQIAVVVRIDPAALTAHLRRARTARKQAGDNKPAQRASLAEQKDAILLDVDATAPDSLELEAAIGSARTWKALFAAIDEANYIEIVDTGSGMSLKDLEDIYLTIGTRHRQKEQQAQRLLFESGRDDLKTRAVLGEKGLGRLAVMRLGMKLLVQTTKHNDKRWNHLAIDWRRFSHDSDELLDQIRVRPKLGPEKDDPETAGTIIRVSALSSPWDEQKLIEIARREFSKITDPFTAKSRFPISVRFNGTKLLIPALDRLLFKYAQAYVEAHFTVEDDPCLSGRIEYMQAGRVREFSFSTLELVSAAHLRTPEVLKSLGPFKVKFYWFNRLLLKRMLRTGDAVGERDLVLQLQRDWSGGLMVFRDGFRVHPYGSGDDDWLQLDPKAFRSGGYKLNRDQIVGKVDISSKRNPSLTDQTNREGLRESAETRALIKLLQLLIQQQFRSFLIEVEKGEQAAADPDALRQVLKRATGEERDALRRLEAFRSEYPRIDEKSGIVDAMTSWVERARVVKQRLEREIKAHVRNRSQMLHLAAMGLVAEILSHELNRATHDTLRILADARGHALKPDVARLIETLEAQLKTLETRLTILSSSSVSGRQRPTDFDVISWVQAIVRNHEAQFARHRIEARVIVSPVAVRAFPVRMVKGMVNQVMENLISNSVYWIKQQRKLDRSFNGRITVTVDTQRRTITVADNGPGVPAQRKEEIFNAFFSLKPADEGKGLGLYISREIAKHHGGSLAISDVHTVHDDRLNTFIFHLGDK
jgi:signal transduction histidine kinase